MDDVVKKSLHDILTAIDEVESFFGNKPKLFDEFCGNICLKRRESFGLEYILPDGPCRDKDREGGHLATFFCWMLPVLQLCQEVGHSNVACRHF